MSQVKDIETALRPYADEGGTIPPAVLRCAARLEELGVWHQFSRNDLAMSCQDAARKRNRLGHKGIPIWDELKSFLGEYDDSHGNKTLFMAHSRGDCELDLAKLRLALGSLGAIRRTTLDGERDGDIAYGTVNPLLVEGIVQVFDDNLQRTVGVPGTVMTNAGSHTWAVEFDPGELVLKLPGARWADIVEARTETDTDDSLSWGVREPSTIGILTGNPSDSGLELWSAINSHVRSLLGNNSLGDVSMPKVVVYSTPQIGISMEMDRREAPLRSALLDSVDRLCDAGAKILLHPAHTTHYFAKEIGARAAARGATFLSMAEVTATHLRQSGVKEIALLGTRFVTDLSLKWSVYRDALQGFVVHQPSEEGWRKIHDLGYEVQQQGATSLCLNWMRDLLKDEIPASCKHVVLAMTEFSPVVRRMKSRGRHGKLLIDPLQLYAEAAARAYLGIR